MINKVFAVFTPGRKENTGGHVVLHKLIKLLVDQGEEVWCTQEPLFPCTANVINTVKSNTDEIIYDMIFAEGKNLVAIYPEQIKGNPFNAKHVTRWILYHVHPDVESTWNTSDEYFYFVPGFRTHAKCEKKSLTIIDGKLDIFRNLGIGEKRTGYCHINKKNYPKGETILKTLESVDLSDFMSNGGFLYLLEEMNKYEFFVTYDDATYYSTIAALCGCRSVILNPNPKITPDEFHKLFPVSRYGVAYGWTDLKHADMTRDLVRDLVKGFEKQSVRHVISFIDFWSKYIPQNENL